MNKMMLTAMLFVLPGTMFAADLNNISAADIKMQIAAGSAAMPVVNQQKIVIPEAGLVGPVGLLEEKSADGVMTANGAIRTCVMRYTAGFSDVRIQTGYCVGNVLFFNDAYASPQVLKILTGYQGQYAVLTYEPYGNAVGCDLITAAQHPIECSIKSSYRNIELSVNGENILPKLKK